MNHPPLNVNRERMDADVRRLAEFTDPALPYTRRAFSPEYAAAREWLGDGACARLGAYAPTRFPLSREWEPPRVPLY